MSSIDAQWYCRVEMRSLSLGLLKQRATTHIKTYLRTDSNLDPYIRMHEQSWVFMPKVITHSSRYDYQSDPAVEHIQTSSIQFLSLWTRIKESLYEWEDTYNSHSLNPINCTIKHSLTRCGTTAFPDADHHQHLFQAGKHCDWLTDKSR